MVRIHARWVVAAVAHFVARWDRPNMPLVGPSVRPDHAGVAVGTRRPVVEAAVPVRAESAQPYPAVSRGVHGVLADEAFVIGQTELAPGERVAMALVPPVMAVAVAERD